MDTAASHGQCLPKVSRGQPFSTASNQRRHALGKKRVPLRRRVVQHHALRIHSQAGFGRGTVKIKKEEEEPETTESEPSSGTKKFFKLPVPSKLPGTVKLQNKSQSQAKTNKVVFVAGATGKVGSRTVRELLKLGFNVRASTRNVEKAQALFEDVASLSAGAAESDDAAPFGIFSPAKLFGFLKPKPGKRLEIVECNLEDPESIEPALGNAGVVVCCIGASEKEVLDVSGPYRIDFKATENLINAASSAEVSHFVLLTSLGTQKFGFPAAVLNLFWGVLLWKAKAEKALVQSGLPYTIVRPGGMERPTDAYKETHNLRLAEADKLFGGQVSNLQVAELLASIVENPDVSVNKIVEAVAETTAPLRPIKELLEEIPEIEVSSAGPQSMKKSKPAKPDVDAKKFSKEQEETTAGNARGLALKEREEKRIQAEKLEEEKRAQAQKEKQEKRIQAERDEKEKQRLQALRKKYEEEIEAAREKEEAAKTAVASALAEKATLEKRAAEIRAKAEAAALAASQAKAVEAAVLAAARKGNVLSDEEKEKIMESVRSARLPKEAPPAEQPKPNLKKKPAFSFLRRAAPFSTVTESETETEQAKDTEKDENFKAKAKADEEAVADKKQESKKLKKVPEAKRMEEQERLEKEAKERAEKEAVEAKQKEEAEAKRKEEELAEAKKKEEEEKAKKETEAKRKEEEELAEAKRKEEEETAKKEAEMLKVEAEEKAKTEEAAVNQAAISAATDEEVKEEEPKEAEAPAPRRKGFRWFWQPAEPETAEMEESEEEQVADVPVEGRLPEPLEVEESKGEQVADVPIEAKEQVADVPIEAKVGEQLPPCPTPLSPYTRYPGMKPPARPIASALAPKAEKVARPKADPVSSEINGVDQTTAQMELPPQEDPTEEPSKESQDDIEARTLKIQEIAAREREALEKAQETISFKWPWQKPETSVEESASASKEEEPAALQEPASSIKEQEAVSPAIQSQEKTDTLPPTSRPLSPYAQFPNLKPPCPPKASSAQQNGSAGNSKLVETLASSLGSLSPYPGFPDLKPPTSPAPLTENGAVPADDDKEVEQILEPAANPGFKWPWQQ